MRSTNKSDNTIKNVKCSLNVFQGIYNYTEMKDINLNISYDLPNMLREKGMAGTSSNVFMNRIKKFLDFCLEFNYIELDIGSHIKAIKKSDAYMQIGKQQYRNDRGKVGRIITTNEMNLIRKTVRMLYPDTFKYSLMIELLLVGGFRIGEVLNIKLSNIDFITGNIRIRRKRNREHEFYLGNDELVQQVRRYCYQNDIRHPNDLIFPKEKDKTMPIAYSTIKDILKRIFHACNLEYGKEYGGFTTHDFRRTCASALYNNGLTLEEIKDILGHDDIRTTSGYITPAITERTKERQRQAVAQSFYSTTT